MKVAVTLKGGKSMVKYRPVFSSDGESIFIVSHNSVFEYNTKTSALIHEYKGIKGQIINFHIKYIDNIECLIVCSDLSHILVWKLSLKIRFIEEDLQLKNVKTFNLIPSNLDKELLALISLKMSTHKILWNIIDIKTHKTIRTVLKLEKESYFMDASDDNYFAVVQNHYVHFVDINTSKSCRYHMAENNRYYTCVACHPNERVVLTGDNTGRMVLWQNMFYKAAQATFHWHTLPVKCMAFSALGNNFFSGADECVLVKWQANNVNVKQFLPRLPAGICQLAVSPNNAYVAVTTDNNAVHIIDTAMNQISVIQQLVVGDHFQCGINYDPIRRCIILNGNTGGLQFFSPYTMQLLYNVDIVNENRITAEREGKIENTEIRKIALNQTSSWLATVEDRRIGTVCKEIRLKFWCFNNDKQMFELNTSIEYPHDEFINSVAFQPAPTDANLKCVTVGDDKKFKVWQLDKITTVYRTGHIWICSSIGSYRNLPCTSLSFSVDGSLFATAFTSILTLWASNSANLKCSLTNSSFKEKLKCVQFGQGNQCYLLVAASERQLMVWNLLTTSMIWMAKLSNINFIIADYLSTYMAVVCEDNQIIIFEPICSSKIFSSKNLMKAKIEAAAFIPIKVDSYTNSKWYERSHFYFITDDKELYSISEQNEHGDYTVSDESVTDLSSEDLSVFSKIKPQTIVRTKKDIAKTHLFEKDSGYRTLKEYLHAPLLTLPPIRVNAASILQSIILQKVAIQH